MFDIYDTLIARRGLTIAIFMLKFSKRAAPGNSAAGACRPGQFLRAIMFDIYDTLVARRGLTIVQILFFYKLRKNNRRNIKNVILLRYFLSFCYHLSPPFCRHSQTTNIYKGGIWCGAPPQRRNLVRRTAAKEGLGAAHRRLLLSYNRTLSCFLNHISHRGYLISQLVCQREVLILSRLLSLLGKL